MTILGEIMMKSRSSDQIPRIMIPTSLMARSLDVKSNIEKKTDPTKRKDCYICDGSHDYARCPELKNISAIL